MLLRILRRRRPPANRADATELERDAGRPELIGLFTLPTDKDQLAAWIEEVAAATDPRLDR
jgi:hypothetical protein